MRDIQVRTRCRCQVQMPVRISWALVQLLTDLEADPATVLLTVRCRHCQVVSVIRLQDFAPDRAA